MKPKDHLPFKSEIRILNILIFSLFLVGCKVYYPENFNGLRQFLINTNTTSFVMIKDDVEIFNFYEYPLLKNQPANVASAGKSVSSIVFGIAMDQGFFSLDDKINQYIENIPTISETNLANITIRNLLNMTSGLNDLLELSYETGSGWEYSDAWNLLFNILETTTGQSTQEFSEEFLFGKLGMSNTEYRDATDSLIQIRGSKPLFVDWKPKQLYTTSIDFVKFGKLILNQGQYSGETIISSNYLEEALTPTYLNPAYGFMFWLNENSGGIAASTGEIILTNIIPNAPVDTISALGAGDKKLYIVPSMNLIVARHGKAAYGEYFAFTKYDDELWTRIIEVLRS